MNWRYQTTSMATDGTATLANEIVDKDVLRKCWLIPKGEEPWTLE